MKNISNEFLNFGNSISPNKHLDFRSTGNKITTNESKSTAKLARIKCFNFSKAIVVDPTKYPKWVYERYQIADIIAEVIKAEQLDKYFEKTIFDEVWIYNVLQHTEDPEKIVKNARKISKIIRVFEWVETDLTMGHPHSFHKEQLDEWFNGIGKVERINKDGCNGFAYYGIFKGNHYEQ